VYLAVLNTSQRQQQHYDFGAHGYLQRLKIRNFRARLPFSLLRMGAPRERTLIRLRYTAPLHRAGYSTFSETTFWGVQPLRYGMFFLNAQTSKSEERRIALSTYFALPLRTEPKAT
jgi:hypothetical protein